MLRFTKGEFDAFLACGILAKLRFDECGLDKLLPFGCKRRGFCPSCGARRMSQAAHLAGHVIPHVPMRQRVLSLPIALCLRAAGGAAAAQTAPGSRRYADSVPIAC